MSPKVTLTIGAAELQAIGRTPRTHLLEAVAAARSRRVWLRCGAVGVVAGLVDWRVDRSRHSHGVSLGGAVLLHLQPEPVEGEEALAAAARALDVPLAWVEGAEAAWCQELMSVAWLARQDADVYLDGFEAGAQTRLIFEGAP